MPNQEEASKKEEGQKESSNPNKSKESKRKTSKKDDLNKSGKKSKSSMKGFVLGLVALLILLFVGGIVYVYSSVNNVSTNPTVVKVAEFLKIPAAKVNNQEVMYSDYIKVRKALGKFYENQPQGFTSNQSESNVSDQAILKLISNNMIKKMAKDSGVNVTAEDIDTRKQELKSQRSDFENQVKNMYGWSFDQFTQYVVEPNLYFDKWCTKYLKESGQQQTNTQQQAQQVLTQIENGADFEEMANQHGSDATSNQGGDLGWISKGDTVKGFEDAVFSMSPGDTQVVETQFGHHVVRVEDTRTTSTPQGQQQQVRARHILFQDTSRNACNQQFDTKFQEADKKILIPINNPFENTSTLQQAPQQQVQPQQNSQNQQGNNNQNSSQ